MLFVMSSFDLIPHFRVFPKVLVSPVFCRNFGSGCEPECLHFIGVLSFDDEFREDVVCGGMPGRMVRSQEPKAPQTRCGKATARY